MSIETLVSVTRDGNLINQDIAIQLDFAADMEMHMPGGMIPFYRYVGLIWQTLDIRQNDYIQDQLNLDPVTGVAKVYQIVSKGESFPDGHMEFRMDDQRIVGFS